MSTTLSTERPSSRMRTAARAWAALRAHLPLAAMVLLGAALAARYALAVDEWRVMTDELLYAKLAVSIADSLSPIPEIRGEESSHYSLLYPLLLSPLVGFFDMPTAFRVAHGLNALLMASAAVPVFLLARRVLPSRHLALIPAALAAGVPWLAFSLSLMTEAVAYPAFAWAIYGIVRAAADPAPSRDALALLGIAVAYLARTQLVFLAAVLPAALVLHEVGMRAATAPIRRLPSCTVRGIAAAVRAHLVVAAAVAVGILVILSGSALSTLGGYQGIVSTAPLLPAGMLDPLYEHVNQILVGVGVLPLPLTAAWIATTLRRPRNRYAHALAVTTAVAVPLLAMIGTRFDVVFGGGSVQERYVFYIAPLLFVGAFACLSSRPVPRLGIAIAGIGTAALLLQSTYGTLGSFPAFASPVRFTFVALDFRAEQISDFLTVDISSRAVLVVGTLVLLTVVLLALRSRVARHVPLALGLGLLAWGVAVTLYAMPKMKAEHEGLAASALGERPLESRDWIDDHAGDGASVAAVPSAINARARGPQRRGTIVDQSVWWEVEFWNKSVRRSYWYESTPGYTPFPSEGLSLEAESGRLLATEGESDYLVLARSNVRLAPEAARRPLVYRELVLYEPLRPYRASWVTEGVYDGGTVASGRAGLTLYGSRRGGSGARTVELTLSSPDRPRRYRMHGRGIARSGVVRGTRTVRFWTCVRAGDRRRVAIETPGTRGLRVVTVAVEAPKRLARRCAPPL